MPERNMADQVLTKQKLIDADEDAQSLDDFINGGDEQIVVTRLLKEYPTLANAIRQIYEKGGKFYPTLAEANADIANIRTDVYVITGDNGAYYKAASEATSLTKSVYDPLTQSKDYTKASSRNLKKFTDENTRSVINSSSVENLFEFSDSQDRPVVAFTESGDILTPDYVLSEIGEKSEKANSFVESALKSNLQETMKSVQINGRENLYSFNDESGAEVIAFTKNGDIIFDGGVSLRDYTKSENKTHFTAKEFIDESFNQAVLSGLAFNRAKTSYLFDGAFKQQFRIKNEADFLGLKISQGAVIDIDTPYFEKQTDPIQSSQIVHPFICTFKNHVHGFKHILLANPFHNTNDLYENPCVWGTNDLNDFVLLDKFDQPLSEFLPTGVRNYNSDNAAIFDHTTGEYVVLFRNSESQALGLYNRHYLLRTSDFINFSSPIKMLKEDGSDLSGSTLNLSPTILFNPVLKKWVMYQVEWDGAAQGLSYRTSDHLEYGWSQPLPIAKNPYMQPWHCEVRYCGQHFIAIVNDINSATAAQNGFGDLFLGISSDGINFTWSDSIFSGGFNNPYKATITHEIVGNSVKFHILWTSNGNDFAGWRLYHSETNLIEVV
ncbi:hypothetical protein CWI32_08225 [Acinetobacter pseudolwoffii]|uniref:Uncharacterized protein n=2 Tax=Acinetobacter pseudolwoffii TaxID=2053287 RepID=A0A2H9YS69_9GAMM|nr:hypothetical protein CWI32_08225 [Acinetobacter pseudolwoffii]